MKKNNLLLVIGLIILIALAMIWVLKGSNPSTTTLPTTPDQTFNDNVVEIPQETDIPLEGLNIAPETIPEP
jgi:hypothetical protein